MGDYDYLRKIPYFNVLSESSLFEINKIAVEKEYKKNTVIFYEGDEGDAIYFVKKGKVKISKISQQGKEHIIRIMEDGDIFAESLLFIGGKYPATAEAIEDSKIIVLKNKDIENLILNNNEVALGIIKLMAKRLQNVAVIIENLALKDSLGRTVSILLTFAREKGIQGKDGIAIELNLSRQDLANMVGTSRENMTRILSQLDKEGVIKLERHAIIIKDVNALKNLS
ncbi:MULTISPECIES: Crp/Fnr family transcriptional regulator [Thermoanaerobacterium]|uniref:CarD family transcriptional regulator n=2 Tax=Thermoanaerobacterium TaxID=28895 RepID=W9EFE7_9THEO|nr:MULTISPECIES: Crp/Fnr family transcriptional regulator [Thermoanaerobacterium]AFK85548.1 transcriptional regulator, Crp/Fnr family [Thermoanaerobacterium saccharolyticum JW/SL-YS485]ETO39735.1 CarD family transcriptional regulator [Thermoanaerobacterium aotearoense SCUT27]